QPQVIEVEPPRAAPRNLPGTKRVTRVIAYNVRIVAAQEEEREPTYASPHFEEHEEHVHVKMPPEPPFEVRHTHRHQPPFATPQAHRQPGRPFESPRAHRCPEPQFDMPPSHRHPELEFEMPRQAEHAGFGPTRGAERTHHTQLGHARRHAYAQARSDE